MHPTMKEYSGSTLSASADLKTSASCSLEEIPHHLKAIFACIHPEVSERYYGCGLVAQGCPLTRISAQPPLAVVSEPATRQNGS